MPKRLKLPSKDADFAHVDQAHAYQDGIGLSGRLERTQCGTVLKKLDAPLTGKVTLKCKLQYANGDGANNGYLAFGDSPQEAQLVKCGLRQKMKTAAIIQGSLAANEGATHSVRDEIRTAVRVDRDRRSGLGQCDVSGWRSNGESETESADEEHYACRLLPERYDRGFQSDRSFRRRMSLHDDKTRSPTNLMPSWRRLAR